MAAKRCIPVLVCLCCALLCAALCTPRADASPICGTGFDPSTLMIELSATAGSFSGYYGVTMQQGACAPDGTWWTWQFNNPSNPIQLWDGTQFIASFGQLGATIFGDPSVNVVYGVSAGPAVTNFTITSGTNIAPLLNPSAVSSAANTLTDTSGNGGSLLGAFSGKSFRSSYNGGVAFADHEENLFVGAFGSTQSTDPDVNGLINATVNSIRATFDFTLSPFDTSGGTGVFNVVPEPAGLSLLAFGLVALTRRRR